jgi:hypothetical protein
MCYPAVAHSIVGVSVGPKVGWAGYNGDVLPASGDVGGGALYGAVLEISSFPLVDFELHANYFTTPFTYTYDVAGSPVSTDLDFRDVHILALVKKNLIPVPGSPFSLHIGGGIGWHVINTEIIKGTLAGNPPPSQADDPVTLFQNNAKMSGHGLAGMRLKFPVMPLAIYGETRYGVIFTDEKLRTFQIEAGVLLSF